VKCTQDVASLDTKKKTVLVGVCTGVLGCFIFMAIVSYFLKSNEIHAVEYDVNTVTAGDYTVEMEVTRDHWACFKENHYPVAKEQGISPGQAFEDYLIMEIYDQMIKLNDRKKKKVKIEKIQIASVQLAFDNSAVIALLKQRGAAIKATNFEEVRNIQK
jgi:hypothetical protein